MVEISVLILARNEKDHFSKLLNTIHMITGHSI